MTAPKNSPWGPVQDSFELAAGIVEISTASHGGIWPSAERQKEIGRCEGNFLGSVEWWEEDCDWAVPYAFFSRDIRAYGTAYRFEDNLKAAVATVRRHHPKFVARLEGRVDPACEDIPEFIKDLAAPDGGVHP